MRGAVGDTDLRVMLAEVASAKACEMMRGAYRPLLDPERPDLVIGTLWIRECKITNDGTRVRFALAGHGWQWADQQQKKAGATFAIRQYVKFATKAVIDGTLDIAYDRNDHVVSLWFTPSKTPQVDFEPVGEVDVDAKGLWSKVMGAVSSAIMQSPDEQGATQAKKQGTQQMHNDLDGGLTVAIDLCTGFQRFSLGHAPKGSLGRPNPGESRRVPIEVHPGGMIPFGLYLAPNGMTIDVNAQGSVRMTMLCEEHAATLTDAFVNGRVPPKVPTLAQAEIRNKGTLKIKPTSCKVAVIAQPIHTPVTFDFQRPRRESGRSTGGPAIHCGAQTAVSSPRDGSGAVKPGAARRR